MSCRVADCVACHCVWTALQLGAWWRVCLASSFVLETCCEYCKLNTVLTADNLAFAVACLQHVLLLCAQTVAVLTNGRLFFLRTFTTRQWHIAGCAPSGRQPLARWRQPSSLDTTQPICRSSGVWPAHDDEVTSLAAAVRSTCLPVVH